MYEWCLLAINNAKTIISVWCLLYKSSVGGKPKIAINGALKYKEHFTVCQKKKTIKKQDQNIYILLAIFVNYLYKGMLEEIYICFSSKMFQIAVLSGKQTLKKIHLVG